MAKKILPQSNLPIRNTFDLLPGLFQTSGNSKFLKGTIDPLTQPGVLQKAVGYIGRRWGKTYNGADIYLDTDNSLRSRYQLEPGLVQLQDGEIINYFDYIDFKNTQTFFGNSVAQDNLVTDSVHYSWNPPIDWDKYINFREYYWTPLAPPVVSVYGQSPNIVSTYSVALGVGQSTYVISPDGVTNNPQINLYRGQTYKFSVNAPQNAFTIRTTYSQGSLLYDAANGYGAGQLAYYLGNLYRSLVAIPPGFSNIYDTAMWVQIDPKLEFSALDYNKGVINNGIEVGTLTFTVPYDAPDLLYYQSLTDPNRFGRIIISDITEASILNVDDEVIGKKTFISGNGVTFTNGLVVEFLGQITPSTYANDQFIVSGVGKAIVLTRLQDLVVPILSNNIPDVLFDNAGFDDEPFDDAKAYPGDPDYLTIARESKDSNPWSRYNRWFHKSILEYAYAQRGDVFPADENLRAKRPIIEFVPNLKLFNHGIKSKTVVDYIDTYTDDVFSKIEGSIGYNVDGEDLFQGARLLVVADKDPLINNKIYEVTFIKFQNTTQIHLVPASDSESVIDECVLIRRGNNAGQMYHFDGYNWLKSQQKTKVNQSPMFDIFDPNLISFSDQAAYPTNNFLGSEILRYKVGNSVVDSHLGFSLSYLNIDNIGDIQFEWTIETDTVRFTVNKIINTVPLINGFYLIDGKYHNGWTQTDNTYIQPIIDSQVINTVTDTVTFNSIDWTKLKTTSKLIINFYINGVLVTDRTYTRSFGTFVFSQQFAVNDALSIKIITDLPPLAGYYEYPVGLEKNPLNAVMSSFTYGQAINHIDTALEWNTEFNGKLPGNSNLRDIGDYTKNAVRFMKHAGLAPVALLLITNDQLNVVKSIQNSKKQYTEYKNKFLTKALELEFNPNIVDFVDDIIASISYTKNFNSPFSDSDMLGTGAYSSINYTVADVGIKTFTLSQPFTLDKLSQRAVYVYINGSQLLHGTEYTFDPTFGFVIISKTLSIGDRIQIREYASTSHNFMPATPTSLGLYKKYTPMKFLDDTYRDPTYVIQGHDGSIIVSFNDFRDDLLLELEYRIYNNIKQKYDTAIFDIDKEFGGYYNSGRFSKDQVDAIIEQEFLRWIKNTNVNYRENSYFVEGEPFTYTYTNMTDPTGTSNLPGWWRGVYQWFYDTDRPHRCPWEMLGFSEKPIWWDLEYGSAPYTSGNLRLWEDLSNGLIRRGDTAGIHDRYKRPTLLGHIPVDEEGKLLDPLTSGLARNFVLVNDRGSFNLGDIAPVEYAWRKSSEYPFAISVAMCLLKPFQFINQAFDRSRTTLNAIGQIVNSDTLTFPVLSDIVIPVAGEVFASGLINCVEDYFKSLGNTVSFLAAFRPTDFDMRLCSRLGGFVDSENQNYILDSKNPKSTSSNIYIPQENYHILLNNSSPINILTYSGVIIEKTSLGWTLTGYDDIYPWFDYYPAVAFANDGVMTVGGVSETFVEFVEGTTYSNSQVVKHNNTYYRSLKSQTVAAATDLLNTTNWQKLPKLPIIGGVTAFRRTNFELQKTKLLYGTSFNNIQDIVDFLLGYEYHLKSIGFVFDNYDAQNQVAQDWSTSCKEFMFWTSHNWATGSLITLSPSSQSLTANCAVGEVNNLLDQFFGYNILKSDGRPLLPQFLDATRSFQSFNLKAVNTTDAIYFARLLYTFNENIVVFDPKTVFNDIIYDAATGYRQERIKSQGFKTTDWYGSVATPGFIYDDAAISVWQPFTDYNLGDMVYYRSYTWTGQENQQGTETFDTTKWVKLSSTPKKQLVPNFDYKINQFDDYFNVSAEGVTSTQVAIARHALGYQSRTYLQNLAEDPVTQFLLYQGFIREKGTINAITKVFNKLSTFDGDSIQLNEEWAFKVGRMGGYDQLSQTEFQISKDTLVLNPQPIIVQFNSSSQTDRYLRLIPSDFTVLSSKFTTEINPSSLEEEPTNVAGYVNARHVDLAVATKADVLNLDITTLSENIHIWITFYGADWTVWRFNKIVSLVVLSTSKSNTTVTINFNVRHNFTIGDIVGFNNITNLTGFFTVIAAQTMSIDVTVGSTAQDPSFSTASPIHPYKFTPARIANYESASTRSLALLEDYSKLWVDNNGSNLWEVVEKIPQYSAKYVIDYGLRTPSGLGTSVFYNNVFNQTVVGIPGSSVLAVYEETTGGLAARQIITPPTDKENSLGNSFGSSTAVSPDGLLMVVGVPKASGVKSAYLGVYRSQTQYQQDDVVSDASDNLYTYIAITPSAGRTLSNTAYWRLTNSTPVQSTTTARGTGYLSQGMIMFYAYINQQWIYQQAFVSQLPVAGENYGSQLELGQDASGNYWLAVSAVNSIESAVYLYTYATATATWSFVQEIVQLGSFANSISFSRDGSILAIGDPSQTIGTAVNAGQVSIYQRVGTTYNLIQTLDGTDISIISDIGKQTIAPGDQFGFALAMDYSATVLVITSPGSNATSLHQGLAYIFDKDATSGLFRLKQQIQSYETQPNESFGYSVAMSKTTEKIVIGAVNSTYVDIHNFTDNTMFDTGTTRFFDATGYDGAVYVFDLKDTLYELTEKLQDNLTAFESFGYSVDCDKDVVVVGSPKYSTTGTIRFFRKNNNTDSWQIIASQKPVVDITKLRSIQMYDNVKDLMIQELDIVDPAKGKILNSAEQELSFKTPYDPAVYMLGNGNQTVSSTHAWQEKYVGQLWWNTSTAKWTYYEQDDISYRAGTWGSQAVGSSIDVYEWVETPYLPSQWSALADTNDGLTIGISGQPLYPNDDVYSQKVIYNKSTGLATGTMYYFWVRNKAVAPKGIPNRRIPALTVASYINNPAGTGIAYLALIDTNKFLAYNLTAAMPSNTALINIEYHKDVVRLNEIHNEYQLMTEGITDNPPSQLENKWIDSLIGQDVVGNRVPDPTLPIKKRYGISFRPRQTIFVNRIKALQIAVSNVNDVLLTQPFCDTINFVNLNSKDPIPSSLLNLYDAVIGTDSELTTVGTTKVRQAKLNVNLVNGYVDSINIIDSGYGYKIAPPVVITGDGIVTATAVVTIDNQGQVASVTVTNKGRRYSTAVATIRQFSVLVTADQTANGFWGIYAWDDIKKSWFRSKSQSYDTTRYWYKQDWWLDGYGVTSRIVKEISYVYEELALKINVGDLIKIKNYGSGGWAVFLNISSTGSTFSDRYQLVGRESGTLQLSTTLYNPVTSGLGFDNVVSYDSGLFDLENNKELRNIFSAIKNDIFIDDYSSQWNMLFFNSIRYALSEQPYVDWVFKTSFLTAVHNVGPFIEKLNYKNDNLSNFQDYINEVKPYRTTVREYISRYDTVELSNTGLSDFDLPSTYSPASGKIISVDQSNTGLIKTYPWKWWADNYTFSVVGIKVSFSGADYTTPPTVLITGDGTGATAKSYIASGKVSAIVITSEGSGYSYAPTITLVGGNGNSQQVAKAVAIIGKTPVRTFNLTMKFDRISTTGINSSFTQSQTFVASGTSAVFKLNYAPNTDKSKILLYQNGKIVYRNQYYINDDGNLVFNIVPAINNVISITYEKANDALDSVNRIQKYYLKGSFTNIPTITQVYYSLGAPGQERLILQSGAGVVVGQLITGVGVPSNTYVKSINDVTVTGPTGQQTVHTHIFLSNNFFIQASGNYNFYTPKSDDSYLGLPGNDLTQLMTGIDFGGVQIQGTTFDVTGGWDAVPWFTDTWDSVRSSEDFYFVAKGGEQVITLPIPPTVGQYTSVYFKGRSASKTVRIDDVNYAGSQVIKAGGYISTKMVTPIDYSVISIVVTASGSYTRAPTAIISASPKASDSSAYTATAAVSLIAISATVVNGNPGTGYSQGDVLTVVISGKTITLQVATITGSSGLGPISTLKILTSDTFTAPLSTGAKAVSGGLGSSATVVITYGVSAVTVTNPGFGYITAPIVSFSSGSAAATATIDNITIPLPFTAIAGDTFIFRKLASDGSVTIDDSNIIDTNLTGGTLDSQAGAYYSATGLNAEDINIDGGQFISPDFVPAPEENIPGQVLDSLSFKVFTGVTTGAAPLHTSTFINDGSTFSYPIGIKYTENTSVIVYLNKVKQIEGTDYIINPLSGQVTMSATYNTGNTGRILEIIALGIGGNSVLDYQEFIADGVTNLFLTQANYFNTGSIFVTVNGAYIDLGFINSSGKVDAVDKTLIQFGVPPVANSVIKIIVLGTSAGTVSNGQGVIRVYSQSYTYDGSNKIIPLNNFVNDPSASPQSSMIVTKNDLALKGPDTIYAVYDGTNNNFTLGVDPVQPAGAILISNIKVFVNYSQKTFIQDYVYDGVTKQLTIQKNKLTIGDIIKIENNFAADYYITGTSLTFNTFTPLTTGDVINITWFGEYTSMAIVEDEYIGGKSEYQLAHLPLDVSYVWVYKNGVRLTQDQDYSVPMPKSAVYLSVSSTTSDQIKIVLFSTKIRRDPSAYEISKDMLNVYRYKRYSANNISLAQDLNYYDQQIILTDADSMFVPDVSRNRPGLITINKEKIEYLSKNGNVLSQLRRGVQGTSIGAYYAAGTLIVDQSISETLPYNETQKIDKFISDGNSNTVSLSYVPSKSTRSWNLYPATQTIPSGFGPCDMIEVFVSGTRLRKDPISQYTEGLGQVSPAADSVIEAEFSVDGITNQIRLTNIPPAGSVITVIKRTGNVWYDKGATTASKGLTLAENTSPIATFIAAKTTRIPE